MVQDKIYCFRIAVVKGLHTLFTLPIEKIHYMFSLGYVIQYEKNVVPVIGPLSTQVMSWVLVCYYNLLYMSVATYLITGLYSPLCCFI